MEAVEETFFLEDLQMNYANIIMSVAKALYSVMRPILLKAVDDPEQEWDDRLMAACDAFFNWGD